MKEGRRENIIRSGEEGRRCAVGVRDDQCEMWRRLECGNAYTSLRTLLIFCPLSSIYICDVFCE